MNKYNNRDHLRALTWAKKIRIVNMLGGKCSICGNSNIFVLEFHHVDDNKENCISRILNKSNTKIDKEACKCIVVCRNCHSEIHYSGKKKTKRILLDIIGRYKCDKCSYGELNFSSLDFHHLKDKKFGFSNIYIGPKIKKEKLDEISIEIKKCSVLCRNCHMIEHINLEYFNYILPLIKYKIKNHVEHRSPEPNRELEINIKNSKYRNKLAYWLKAWRKFKCIRTAATFLKIKNNMLSNNLQMSKIYRKIRQRLSKKTSKYIGVSYSKRQEKWLACKKIKKKTKIIGYFNTEDAAHNAYLEYIRNQGII